MGKIDKVIETARLIGSLQELGEILQKAHHPDIVAGVRVPKQLHEHDEPVPHEHPHRELAAKFVLDVHRRNPFEGARMSEKYLGIGEGGKALHPNALPPDQRKKYVDIKDDDMKKADYRRRLGDSGYFSPYRSQYLRDQDIDRQKREQEAKKPAQSSMSLKDIIESNRRRKLGKAVKVQPAMVSTPLIANPAGMPVDERNVSNSPAVMNPYKMDKCDPHVKVNKILSSLKGRK